MCRKITICLRDAYNFQRDGAGNKGDKKRLVLNVVSIRRLCSNNEICLLFFGGENLHAFNALFVLL